MPASKPRSTLRIRRFLTNLFGRFQQTARRLLVTIAPRLFDDRFKATLTADPAFTELVPPGSERPLDLEDAYLPLKLLKHQRRPGGPQAAGAAAVSVPQGLPYRRGAGGTTSIDDALLQSSQTVVLGGPGSGKTTLFRYLALMLAQDRLPVDYVRKLTFTHHDEAKDHLLPIFVSLPDLAQQNTDIMSYVRDRLADLAFPCPEAFLHRRLEDGDCLLLLDALDGIEDEERRQMAIRQIQDLAARYGQTCQILVNARLVGYRHDLDGFAHLELAPFDHEDVERFVTGWFAEQPSRADDLLAVLERSPRMRSMAANPLLLSTLAVAQERQDQPRARSVTLYEACVAILLGGERDDALERCVQRLAHDLQCGKRSRFSKEELSIVIKEVLSDTGDGPHRADDLLNALTKRTYLLPPVSETSYAFIHPALQAYLAAREALAAGDTSELTDRLEDPWWQEVMVLVCGLRRDAADLVEAILGLRDTMGDEALLLAARCLHDADRTDEGLRQHVRASLFEIFDKDGPAPWSRAAMAIAGLEGERRAQAFGHLLRSDDPQVRRGAASVLGHICEAWGVVPLIAALGDEASEVRSRAAWALGILGDERAVHPLLKLLGEDDRDVRREAIQALGAIGEPALDPLIRALGDRSDDVRRRVARALSQVGDAAVPALLRALASPRREVRDDVVLALTEIGAAAVGPLVTALQSENRETRRGAVAALGHVDDGGATPLIVKVLGDADPAVRSEAAVTLAAMGARAVDALIAALTDVNPRVSEQAATVLTEIGDPAVDGLLRALGDERRALRWAVVKVLGTIGAQNPGVVSKLRDLLGDGRESVRQSAVRALAQIGDASAVQALIRALAADEEAVRGAAAEALADLGGDEVVHQLRKALQRGLDPDRAIALAGRIRSRAAHDFLRELLESDDRAVRDAAASALETDKTSGLYFYRAWEPRIHENLLERGAVTTAMLTGTPNGLRTVVLQRYVNRHPEMDLSYDAEMGLLRLNTFSRSRKVVEYWNRAGHNLGDEVAFSEQMFEAHVTSLAEELCAILDVTAAEAESEGRLYAFALDVSSVVQRTSLPRTIPLIFLRRDGLSQGDLDDLRALLKRMKVFHRTALLVLFGPQEVARRARVLLDRRLRDVHAFDVVILGRREIQHIVTAKDAPEALRFTICDQADLTLVSPYSFDEPASRMLFFGREFEIRSITQAIPNSSVAVLGGRRIGKTSILHKVSDVLCERYCCHYMDFHAIRNYDILFRTMAYRWPAIGRLDPEPVNFHAVVTELRDDGPLILVLDEIDALLRFDVENDELLFKTFRSLSQEGLCRFIFSGERVLSRQLKYGSTSPLFNFCGQRIRLGYLEPKSARQLVLEPMSWMNIELQEPVRIVEDVLDLSSCHPRLIQYICHALIKEINREGVRFVTDQHLQRIAGSNEFREEYLWTVWGDTTPFERALTLALEQVTVTLDEIRAALRHWGIPYAWEDLKAALYNLEICSILERDDGTFRLVPKRFPRIARESLDIEMEISALKRRMERECDL